MIYFFADNHYGVHPGKVIFENLSKELQGKTCFFEDDWSKLEEGSWTKDCSLLVLNLIGATCDIPHPGPGAEKAVRSYVESGKNLLLLHGSSAAFWQWDWWRTLPGLRWVRSGDPDNVPVSSHPYAACSIVPSKTRHPLVSKLKTLELPEDEIYTELEQVSPMVTLMETTVLGHTWPQCVETKSPAGGRIVSFIPGHKPECTAAAAANIEVLIRDLMQ